MEVWTDQPGLQAMLLPNQAIGGCCGREAAQALACCLQVFTGSNIGTTGQGMSCMEGARRVFHHKKPVACVFKTFSKRPAVSVV